MACHSVSLANEKTDVLFKKSYAAEAEGNYQQAAGVIEPILNRKSSVNEFVWLRYAWLHYQQRNYNDAIRAYNKAMKLNASSVEARLGITLPLLAQQRWKEAAIYSKQVVKKSPLHYIAHMRLMLSEEGQKNWKDLKNHAKVVVSYYPSEYLPYVYLARAQAWLGESENARESYQQVLVRYPDNLEALGYLGKGGA